MTTCAAHVPLQWSHRDTRDVSYATFTVGKLVCTVSDCDGDFSTWNIKEGDTTIVEGEHIYDSSTGPYHFDLATNQAEAALIVEATKRGLYRPCCLP